MERAGIKIKDIVLQDQGPSVIPSWQLYCWTKYCVGERRGDNYRYGAVKPPSPTHNWFPAAVNPDTILIACSKTFPTPEKAVEWLRTAGQAGRRKRGRYSRSKRAR
jgi:hypothetical protein